MSVRKQQDGSWMCECYPHGRNGKRVRKKFPTKGEATSFERHIMQEVAEILLTTVQPEPMLSQKMKKAYSKTQNLKLTLLKSAFNELIRLKEWLLPKPFGDIRKINVTENELSFLTSEQIKEMFTL